MCKKWPSGWCCEKCKGLKGHWGIGGMSVAGVYGAAETSCLHLVADSLQWTGASTNLILVESEIWHALVMWMKAW